MLASVFSVGVKNSICTPGTSLSTTLDRLGSTSSHDGLLGTVATAIKKQTAALLVLLPFSPWAIHSVLPSGGGVGMEISASAPKVVKMLSSQQH